MAWARVRSSENSSPMSLNALHRADIRRMARVIEACSDASFLGKLSVVRRCFSCPIFVHLLVQQLCFWRLVLGLFF